MLLYLCHCIPICLCICICARTRICGLTVFFLQLLLSSYYYVLALLFTRLCFFFFFVEAAWNERFVELGHLCAVPANCCCVCFKYFFRCLLPRFLGFLSMQKDWQKIAVSFFLASFLRVSVNVKGNNLFLS